MIIGVAGEKKHGKDTVALYLKEKYSCNKLAFADRLRSICADIFPKVDFYDDAIKEAIFPEPIQIMREHITYLINDIEQDYSISEDQEIEIFNVMYAKGTFTSVRDILQFVGTEVLRTIIDPDFHYNNVAKVVKKNPSYSYVISDVRFKNEREGLKKDFNALLLFIERPSMQRNETSGHASENSLGDKSEYDHVIINDGTLEDLYAKIDGLLQE